MIQVFSNSLGAGELKALKSVFKSKWIGFGRETKIFEKELGKKIGSQRVLALNSCTSGLFMSMKILKLGPGDEVIIPTINFIGTANAVLAAGAKPVFADVDPEYLNILPSQIKKLRTRRTRAIILLHYGGHPCDMDEIYKYTKGLHIIEDSANSPFSKYKGKNCGTLGDIGCFSFDAMKILSVGNGGAIWLKDDALYKRAVEYRYFGLRNKKQSGVDSFKEKKSRWWEIELSCVSNRFIPCDILSSIGRVQLSKVDSFIGRRKQIWKVYQKELSGLYWLTRPPEPLNETRSSYYLYWIRVCPGLRDKLARHLVDNGVYCTFRYFPLHLIKHYKAKQHLPNSEELNQSVLNIPLHQNISDRQVDKIIKVIKRFGSLYC
ncbi:MAG: DegT/DnrJ/EryC1/StrS family aminotransferase [Candidatus Omnitrophica bacterium]|nr:DegT/DnrJ/EryC1/StrS family aminotransferase [Candidatus Omnitrophota bacterium]